MKILVCISHVPDTTSKIDFVDQNTKLDTTNIQYIIGPYEDYALSRAVELKESHQATVTVLNVGRQETEATLRKSLAIGADDAIRVDADPLDSFFVATQIAQYAKTYDLILMGRESIDFNGGVVHAMTAALMGIPCISPVMKLDVDGQTIQVEKEIEGGKATMEASLPIVLGCQEPIAEWKIPNMRGIMSARTKPLVVQDQVSVDLLAETTSFALPPAKGQIKMIEPDQVEELVNLLKKEAKVI